MKSTAAHQWSPLLFGRSLRAVKSKSAHSATSRDQNIGTSRKTSLGGAQALPRSGAPSLSGTPSLEYPDLNLAMAGNGDHKSFRDAKFGKAWRNVARAWKSRSSSYCDPDQPSGFTVRVLRPPPHFQPAIEIALAFKVCLQVATKLLTPAQFNCYCH